MKKWLKIASGLVVAVVLTAVFAGAALAQGPVADGDGIPALDGSGFGRRYGFVDEDGDGVNDRSADGEFVDEDGDGLCDTPREEPYGRGYGFVDEDSDGVNDRSAEGEFVDEDGDGLCDTQDEGLAQNQRWARSYPSMGQRQGTVRQAAER